MFNIEFCTHKMYTKNIDCPIQIVLNFDLLFQTLFHKAFELWQEFIDIQRPFKNITIQNAEDGKLWWLMNKPGFFAICTRRHIAETMRKCKNSTDENSAVEFARKYRVKLFRNGTSEGKSRRATELA
jgi:hypothetical protein